MSATAVTDLLMQTPGIDVLVALTKIDPMRLSPSERVDFLAALEKQSGWLQALMQVAIVAVAGARAEEDRGKFAGVDDPQREEIASALNLAPVTAQSRIDVARTLTQHLPATCVALANGEISSAQATVIAKESAALLRKGIDPDQLRFLEETAIAYSEFHTPTQVTNKVRSIVAKLEPAEFEVVVAEAAQGRRVTFTAQPHGMAQILALLPAAEAQTVWLAIDKLARSNRDKGLVVNGNRETGFTGDSDRESGFTGDAGRNSGFTGERGPETGLTGERGPETGFTGERGPETGFTRDAGRETGFTGDAGRLEQSVGSVASLPEFISSHLEPLTLDQLRADALSMIAGQFLAESASEHLAHGRPVTLNLTLDLPTFLGLNEKPGILAGYGEIPASTARLLAADAKWRRFITDPLTGNLLDYGRTTYVPPQALVDFIVARDRRCRFPGCRQPARVCDIDHAIPWEEGGETSKENLGLLCRRHHRMKTHGGWKLISFADGSCEWISPEGKRFLVEARPVDEVA